MQGTWRSIWAADQLFRFGADDGNPTRTVSLGSR